MNVEMYSDLVLEWHPTKNGTLTLADFTESSAKKVWWKCSKDFRHEWESRVFARTKQSQGCPYCKGKKVLPEDSMAVKFPHLLESWDCQKNNIDPNTVHCKSAKKVWWKCEKGHEYQARVFHRTTGGRNGKGTGCPYCSNQKPCDDNSVLKFPGALDMWCYAKNEIQPDEIVVGSRTKVWWKCPQAEDHEWMASPRERFIKGFGCPFCSGHRLSIATCIAVTHPSVAAEWHPIKNGDLTPKDVTRCSQKKVWFQCLNDPSHEWQTRVEARTRLNNTQCPFCASSKGEAAIKSCLDDYNIPYIKEYKIEECKNKRSLPFDFAIFDLNNELFGLIEFQGRQHYESVECFGGEESLKERVKNDKIKKEYCAKNNIRFLEIDYDEIGAIDLKIISFTTPILKARGMARVKEMVS